MIGTIVTADEVKARWAYSEMVSTRWAKHFVGKHQVLVQKAQSSVPFDALTQSERDELVQALLVSRHPTFVANIDQSAPKYQFQQWTKGQLCQTWALPAFNAPAKAEAQPYYDFFIRWPDTGPSGEPEDSDPRVVFARSAILFDPNHEPVIFVGQPSRYVLIEGTLRSVIFMHSPGNAFRLNAWVPQP